jgi:hypothetical protein
MKRRKFLAIAGIGGLFASLVSFRFVNTSFEEAAEKLIVKELDFLNLDRSGVRKFVNEYAKSTNSRYRLTMKGYSFMGLNADQSVKVNQLINAYLLSTDFFTNKMDESRVVKYVELYNPYLRPCANPFTHVHFPEGSMV